MEELEYRPAWIVRYTSGQRINHWLVALCFALAALSGLSMFHPALFWLSGLFGGGTWARILHPFLGVAMALAFVGLVIQFARGNWLGPGDRQWLRQWRDVVTAREEDLPEMGKYNGGQKAMFWFMVACMLVLTATGFLFWRPYLAPAFPVWLVRLATLVHSATAVLLVIGI